MKPPATIRDVINAPDFFPFPRSSDEWHHNPERMARVDAAAEHGSDGSTHAEHIQDWRDYAAEAYKEARRALDYGDPLEAELDALEAELDAELDALETWHEQNGTLHTQIA